MRTRRRSTQPGSSGNRSTSSPPSAAPAVAASAAAERGVEGDDPSTIQRDFAASVWRLVTRIPQGRVTTYGHIAKQLGYPRHARMVGQSLKMLPSHRASPLLEDGTTSNPDFVPWHRVVNAKGDISPRGNVSLVISFPFKMIWLINHSHAFSSRRSVPQRVKLICSKRKASRTQ